MSRPSIAHIARLALNVHDLERAGAFYEDALGFARVGSSPGALLLRLGAQHLELVEQPEAAPYPHPRAANDPWFQHFAIRVTDMDAACAHLSRFSPEPITRGGPQLLPPSTGSVTAYKFRDPDGHPLELSYVPGGDHPGIMSIDRRSVFAGIDHTAIAISDLEASVAFYTGLGFRVGERLLNRGPEQSRLDGLDEACLDIVTLFTPEPGPHLELLRYRRPAPSPARPIAGLAATQTMLTVARDADRPATPNLTDPDGHLLRLLPMDT